MIKATILVEELNNKKYDELLNDIYVDTNLLDYQRERYVKAINKYVSLYGDTDVEIYSAPGRSEVRRKSYRSSAWLCFSSSS